ncbi:MAG: NADH-quinone oxidoreductase subunit J, partial [Pseudomonas sp.]
LFVFVVMMLNLGNDSRHQERQWLSARGWIGPGILSGLLLAQLLYVLFSEPSSGTVSGASVDAKAVGFALFGPYILAVELAAMMLLAAMVTAFHIGRHEAKEIA